MKTIQIAIDGPASSGKSTVAKIIAKDFGYTYLDTGAMYRAATYIALNNQVSPEESSRLLELLEQYPISFGRAETGEQLVFVGDVDVTNPIRENEVTNAVSAFAAIPAIREKLVALQQEIAQQGGIVMDGRDIGTVVLPKAELKIFLVASVDERAERRYKVSSCRRCRPRACTASCSTREWAKSLPTMVLRCRSPAPSPVPRR